MHNMLIRPTEAELENYGKPDFTILNAGEFPANRYTSGMTSPTSIAISFHRHEMGKSTKQLYLDLFCSNSGNSVCGGNEKGRVYRNELLDAQGRCSFSSFQLQRWQ